MPLITIGIQKQLLASSSGVNQYPNLTQLKVNTEIGDDFNRETLTPSDFPLLYATAITNSAAITLVNAQSLQMTSGGTINSQSTVRTSQLNLQRTPPATGGTGSDVFDTRSSLEFVSIFKVSATTTMEAFVGLLDSEAALTGLPTTASHLGLQLNTASSANYFFTSADGSTQTTVDTGVSSTDNVILVIKWTGDNSASMELFNISGVSQFSTAVTALGTVTSMELHFFTENLASAGKTLTVDEWKFKVT